MKEIKKKKFRDYLVGKLVDCVHEQIVTGFHAKLEKLKSEKKQKLHDFFSKLSPQH